MKIEVKTPLEPLAIVQLHGTKWWLVKEDYTFYLKIDDVAHNIFVPSSFRYDRASIHWEVLVTKDSLGSKAPLIHDLLCRFHGNLPSEASEDEPWIHPWRSFTRVEADQIFREVMLADEVVRWKAWAAWFAVRMVTEVHHW